MATKLDNRGEPDKSIERTDGQCIEDNENGDHLSNDFPFTQPSPSRYKRSLENEESEGESSRLHKITTAQKPRENSTIINDKSDDDDMHQKAGWIFDLGFMISDPTRPVSAKVDRAPGSRSCLIKFYTQRRFFEAACNINSGGIQVGRSEFVIPGILQHASDHHLGRVLQDGVFFQEFVVRQGTNIAAVGDESVMGSEGEEMAVEEEPAMESEDEEFEC